MAVAGVVCYLGQRTHLSMSIINNRGCQSWWQQETSSESTFLYPGSNHGKLFVDSSGEGYL